MTSYQRTEIRTSNDVRAVADHAGSHFFAAPTMRFFSSRLLEGVHAPDGHETAPGRRYVFVTSERHDGPRHYTVRMMTLGTVRDDRPWADIETVGDYYSTAAQARKAAKELAESIA